MRAQSLIRLFLLPVLTLTALSFASSLPHDENKGERGLPLKSILRRRDEVFVSNDAGVFRASLAEKKWHRVNMLPTMPLGGRFADEPEDAKAIYYYASQYPYTIKSDKSDAHLYGLYLSEDDGQSWRLVSAKDDYGPVFLHPNGTLYAVTNSVTFRDHAHIWMSKDQGESWREITGGTFGMILYIFADPDHPDLICLFGNSIRGYVFQPSDENYEWHHIVEWDWSRSHPPKGTLPAPHYATTTTLYMLTATLDNYFDYDFGKLTFIPAFDLAPEKTDYTFKKDQPKVVSLSLRFLPDDSEIPVGRLEQPTAIKIPDQKNGTDLWGINILNPDGTRTFIQSRVTKTVYESHEREQALSKIKAAGNFQVFEFNHEHPLTRSIDLGKLYDFSLQGTYRVQLIYDNISLDDKSDGKWVGSFGSRAFEVTIR